MTAANKAKLAEALKTAIKGEVDGYKFYHLCVERSNNNEARRRLEQLRDDEIRHKDTLYELYDQLIGGRPESLPEKGLSALAKVFAKGKLDASRNEVEIINLAIEAELAAMDFYQNAQKDFDDPQLLALFDQLAEEESSHYEVLQAEKEALGGNYHWFSMDESSPMEH